MIHTSGTITQFITEARCGMIQNPQFGSVSGNVQVEVRVVVIVIDGIRRDTAFGPLLLLNALFVVRHYDCLSVFTVLHCFDEWQ